MNKINKLSDITFFLSEFKNVIFPISEFNKLIKINKQKKVKKE
ncbi:unnamed protein product [marine sediment metagenome]|uniref:Uncharacterized protein n=1 Tax=marine sediment metagenome TaxID=412755 RepID=X0YDM2_9ZZZZ